MILVSSNNETSAMFVVYHKETTRIPHIKGKHWETQAFKSERSAKAALTRAINDQRLKGNREDYAVAERAEFHEKIEKLVSKTNLMSGERYLEPINTPAYLSPACESYWSM